MFLPEGEGKSSFWKTAMALLLPAALSWRGSQQEEIKTGEGLSSGMCWLCQNSMGFVRTSWEQQWANQKYAITQN